MNKVSINNKEKLILAEVKVSVENIHRQRSEERREKGVKELEIFVKNFLQNEDIAAEYVKGLSYLLYKQKKIEKSKETFEKIEDLAKRYKDNKDIILFYAKGINYLLVLQKKSEEIKENVLKLFELAKKYIENKEIAAVYALAVYNAVYKEDIKGEIIICYKELIDNVLDFFFYYSGVRDTIDIVSVYKYISDNYENAKFESKKIYNFCGKLERLLEKEANKIYKQVMQQDTKESIKEFLNKLESYTKENIVTNQIALMYLKGFYKLIYKQRIGQEKEKTVKKMVSQCSEYEKKALWSKEYVKIDLELKKIEKIVKRYIGSEKIALTYIDILSGLLYKKDTELKREIIVEKIEKEVVDKYPENEKIALKYAVELYNLANEQEEIKKEKTVEKLEKLLGKYQENEKIAEFAKGMSDLKIKHNKEKKVSEDKCKKEKLNEKKFNENLPPFLAEAKLNYYLVRKKNGFSDDDYLDNSPFDVCGFNEGIKKILKWEVYEKDIKLNNKYREDIIARKSGSIVKIDVQIQSTGFESNFVDWENPSEHIYTTLKNYTSALLNRSAEDAKQYKNAEMEARKKINTIYKNDGLSYKDKIIQIVAYTINIFSHIDGNPFY